LYVSLASMDWWRAHACVQTLADLRQTLLSTEDGAEAMRREMITGMEAQVRTVVRTDTISPLPDQENQKAEEIKSLRAEAVASRYAKDEVMDAHPWALRRADWLGRRPTANLRPACVCLRNAPLPSCGPVTKRSK
jgi:hypothetical protein